MPDDLLHADLACYAATPGLLLRQWDMAQAVVFHPATNSTHLVDALAGSVLAALSCSEPLRTAALDAVADDPTVTSRLGATLDALAQVGLIRCTG